jgi:hypothetical protein
METVSRAHKAPTPLKRAVPLLLPLKPVYCEIPNLCNEFPLFKFRTQFYIVQSFYFHHLFKGGGCLRHILSYFFFF